MGPEHLQGSTPTALPWRAAQAQRGPQCWEKGGVGLTQALRLRERPFSSELLGHGASQPCCLRKSTREGGSLRGPSGPAHLGSTPGWRGAAGAHPVLPGQPPGGTRPPQLVCHLPAHHPMALGSPLMFGQNQGSPGSCQWGCVCSSVWGVLEDPCLVTDPCGQLPAPKRGPTLLGHLPILMLVPGATGHQLSDAEPLGPPNRTQ